MTVFLWAILGYAAGSFPSVWLVAVATGKRSVLDRVRREAGEADAHVLLARSGGRGAAMAAAIDVVKGFVCVVAAARFGSAYDVAACAIGAVTGHCWPPLLTRYAGRGLAAAAGVFLAFAPVEMVVAGIVRLLGGAMGGGGLSSTIGFVAIPAIALWRGQPLPFVLAAVVVNLLIFARRLEGVGDDIARGAPVWPTVANRAILDVSTFTPRTSRFG